MEGLHSEAGYMTASVPKRVFSLESPLTARAGPYMYLGPADTGPVLRRLRGDRQSVSHLQSGCATPHAVLLASIRTPWSRALPHGSPRRHVCDPLRAGAREHAILHDRSPCPYL